jgi:hypothetical protein
VKHLRVKNLSLIIIGLILSCIIFEIALRITDKTEYNRFVNDPSSGLLTYRPNISFLDSESCFENRVEINNLGFNSSYINQDKSPSIYRIVVIGSSFVEALQVGAKDNFAKILEEELNQDGKKYEVISIGFSGNKTLHNILYYQRFAENLKPDLVINLVTEYESRGVIYSETSDGKLILSLPNASKDSKTAGLKNLMRKSKLIMNVYNKLIVIKANQKDLFDKLLLKKKVEEKMADGANEEQWRSEEKLLKEFDKIVKKDNSKFLLLSWSTPHISDKTKTELSENLFKISSENKFSYFDLSPEMSRISSSSGMSPVWSCNDHWSKYGHQIAGEIIYEYLKKNQNLIKK